MFNSKGRLFDIFFEYLTLFFLSSFFTFLISVPTIGLLGWAPISLIVGLFSFFIWVLIKIDASYSASYEIRSFDKAFMREQIVKDFANSQNYNNYVRAKVDNPEEFIQSMSNVAEKINDIEEVVRANDNVSKFVSDYAYLEKSKERLVFLLMNPEAYEPSKEWAEKYMDKFHKYTMQYYFAELNNDKYIPNIGPLESKEKMIKESNNINDVLRLYRATQLDDIHMFLNELNYVALQSK